MPRLPLVGELVVRIAVEHPDLEVDNIKTPIGTVTTVTAVIEKARMMEPYRSTTNDLWSAGGVWVLSEGSQGNAFEWLTPLAFRSVDSKDIKAFRIKHLFETNPFPELVP